MNWWAVVPNGHALAGRAFLEATDFVTEPFVTFSSALERGKRSSASDVRLGLCRRVVYAGSSDAVCTYISQDFGFSILSRRAAARHEMVSSFRCLPLTSASLSADRHAVTRDDAGKDPAVSLLLDSLLGWSA